MAVSQLIDYSSLNIPMGLPIGIIPITPLDLSQSTNAEYFTEQLIHSLCKNKTFNLVERKELKIILDELKLQMTGIVDEENASKIGNLMGAKMLIIGKFYAGKENNYELFLKLLQVETGEILAVTKSIIDVNLGLH